MANAFSEFIDSVEHTLAAHETSLAIVDRIEPLLHALVMDHDWLDQKFQRAIPKKPYSQYLLHRPADKSFSVVSFVWRPDNGSPVHDHCTWGVIGQHAGEEEETRFRRLDDGSNPESAHIEKASVGVFRPGDVSHVYPPERDVHQIWNRTTTPTVSVHVYGGDIGAQQRHTFDAESGRISPFVSGYDLPQE